MDMLRSLRARFAADLKDFASSTSRFRVLWSVPQKDPAVAAHTKLVSVVDSSFNPPSRAHLHIATSALQADPTTTESKRLLLLLATQNADKAPKPASFEDRLVMMTILAREIERQVPRVAVDVGVTKEPYFHAKAAVVDQSGYYGQATQVYGVGFDSLLRIFDRKYYGDKGFETLRPFLGRHKVRATLRLDDKWGGDAEQRGFVEAILKGERQDEGIDRSWGQNIEIVEGKKEGEMAVSSTKAREAAKDGDVKTLETMVVDEVAKWILEEGLYKTEGG